MKLEFTTDKYKIIEEYCIRNKTFAVDVFNKIHFIDNEITASECMDIIKSNMDINNLMNIKNKSNSSLAFIIRNYYAINRLMDQYDMKAIIESIKEVEDGMINYR